VKRILIKCIANSYNQAHLQFTRANAKVKTCHSTCLCPNADLTGTKILNLFKTENGMTELKAYLKPLIDKNLQLVAI
jgi:hypothetical protein